MTGCETCGQWQQVQEGIHICVTGIECVVRSLLMLTHRLPSWLAAGCRQWQQAQERICVCLALAAKSKSALRSLLLLMHGLPS
jgi:hypothetical protein